MESRQRFLQLAVASAAAAFILLLYRGAERVEIASHTPNWHAEKEGAPDNRFVQTEINSTQILDFGVVGFAKCGTSFLLHYLLNTDETFLGGGEHCLGRPNPKHTKKVLSLYEVGHRTADGARIKNGLKCPKGLTDPWGVVNYEMFLPEMRFIVSLRHPVLWFQSFYNFRLKQNILKGEKPWKPQVKDLIGPCNNNSPYVLNHFEANETNRKGVCTDGSKFHHYLSRLGKTAMNTEHEAALLVHDMSIHSFPKAQVFIMEINQFSPHNVTLGNRLRKDLQHFLGLDHELPPLKPHVPEAIQDEICEQFINICDQEHDFIRGILIENGQQAYKWITEYFIESEGVHVSSREHFVDLLKQWTIDPCKADDAI